jgi:hypothetical protein
MMVQRNGPNNSLQANSVVECLNLVLILAYFAALGSCNRILLLFSLTSIEAEKAI